jgi:glycosyltransferase involved in cell wall biosynthesis
MDQPLVTIIITTYNYAHTVGTAIESALNQDHPNLEVLVVDNASTDATPALAARFAGDARFRYLRNAENIGMVPNHNKGLREARGSYVLFLSADDFLMPHHISRSLSALRDHPEIDVLYTATYFVDEQERFIGLRQMTGQPLAPYFGGRNEFAGLFTEGCYMCFPTMLMRRDLYDRFGELDETIKAADYEIVVRWAANGVRFGYVPEPTCAVRLHANQQSSSQNYVADFGDVREYVYLVQRFADRYGDQLAGFESSVSRQMWNRYQIALNSAATDGDGAVRALLLECDGLLAGVKQRNAALPVDLHPTVIVLPSSRPADTERTLRSLKDQTYGGWDALALEYANEPFAAIGSHIDPTGRIAPLRLLGRMPDPVAINQALRVARGNVFLVLRPGAVLPPDHLERVLDVCRSSNADIVRTGATYDGQRIFIPPSEGRLSFIAPYGPIESLVFTRRTLDRSGPFNSGILAFADWEFFLRALPNATAMALDSEVTLARPPTHEQYAMIAGLPNVARMLHTAYATTDDWLLGARERYLLNLESIIAEGAEAATSPVGLGRLLVGAYGTELFAGAR